ncbi:uncharacterized protein AB675_752 [Cyphellophora attinorum]|uniref:Ubiquitin-like domain-containing protein n=1 Tax=Cyphellophora attinorum TaxID=1664694 RepID=A0A0N1HI54_9EURO|nr:uncharacterized protein AB675_752 [Phialophora attinorum]KPI45917.1 hypothetical protein AB675_752 [Phialophora attinorum]
MSGPAFGFSVGDFVTAIEATTTIIKALKQTGGASSRYIQVLQRLQSLRRILDELESFQPSDSDSAYVNAIRGAARAAKFPLDDFLAKMEKYEPALNPTNRASISRRAPRSVKWALWVEEEVEKLQIALDAQCSSLSLLMQLRQCKVGDVRESRRRAEHEGVETLLKQQVKSSLSNSDAIEDIRRETTRGMGDILTATASVQASTDTNAAILTDVKRIAISLVDQANEHDSRAQQHARSITQAMMDNTAQLLKLQLNLSAMPQTTTDSSIHLVDALDRPQKLPYEFFQTFEMIHAHLSTKFRYVPGGAQVNTGLYQLVLEGRSPRVVDADNWSTTVFPGSRVTIPKCRLLYHPASVQRLLNLGSGRSTIQQVQKKHDTDQYGRRIDPADVSVIASISNPTLSQFSRTSKASTAMSAKRTTATENELSLPRKGRKLLSDAHPASEETFLPLTRQNLQAWESFDGHDAVDVIGQLDAMFGTGKDPTLPVIDWSSSPSGMMAWLNSSALPASGNSFPEIEDVEKDQNTVPDNEVNDLEVLRRVCIPWSTPAACHYLDASEYQGMTGPAVLHLRRILDLFPRLSSVLARRLAQNNHTQAQTLAKVRAAADGQRGMCIGSPERPKKRTEAAIGNVSSGSVEEDDHSIADFIKLLEAKKELSDSRTDNASAASSTRRTTAALDRFHRMKDSYAALSDSVSPLRMLQRSSDRSSAGETPSERLANMNEVHHRQNSDERHYGRSPKSSTSAISKALDMTSRRLFGTGYQSPVNFMRGRADDDNERGEQDSDASNNEYNNEDDSSQKLKITGKTKHMKRPHRGRRLYDDTFVTVSGKRAHSAMSSRNSSMRGDNHFDTDYQRTKARRESAGSGASYHIEREDYQFTSPMRATGPEAFKSSPQFSSRTAAVSTRRCELCDRDVGIKRQRDFHAATPNNPTPKPQPREVFPSMVCAASPDAALLAEAAALDVAEAALSDAEDTAEDADPDADDAEDAAPEVEVAVAEDSVPEVAVPLGDWPGAQVAADGWS